MTSRYRLPDVIQIVVRTISYPAIYRFRGGLRGNFGANRCTEMYSRKKVTMINLFQAAAAAEFLGYCASKSQKNQTKPHGFKHMALCSMKSYIGNPRREHLPP